MAAKPERRFKVVADNRKARFNYAIGETFEAGIVLEGWDTAGKGGVVRRLGWALDPRSFIHPVPHMSFVHDAADVAFLKRRFAAMSAHHCYEGMQYSEDRKEIDRKSVV